MSAYPKDDEGTARGTWRFFQDLQTGHKAVVFTCPNCGHPCPLIEHEIDADGLVFPKLNCPAHACSFNQYIELKDWIPPRS